MFNLFLGSELIPVLFVLTGCLTSFLASAHQQFLTKPLPMTPAWSIFLLCLFCGWWLNLQFYSPVIAAILVLVSVMLIWPIIVLGHGHLKVRLMPFALVGGATCASLIIMSHSGFADAVLWLGVMHVV